MEKNIIKMKKSYTVTELAKKAHEKANDNITLDIYANAATNMAVLHDYVTTKIEPDDMVKLFDYLAGINRKSGED